MRASMPKTPVHKHRNALARKCYVGPPRNLPLQAIPRNTRFAQSASQQQFGLGVLAFIAHHALMDRVLYGHFDLGGNMQEASRRTRMGAHETASMRMHRNIPLPCFARFAHAARTEEPYPARPAVRTHALDATHAESERGERDIPRLDRATPAAPHETRKTRLAALKKHSCAPAGLCV